MDLYDQHGASSIAVTGTVATTAASPHSAPTESVPPSASMARCVERGLGDVVDGRRRVYGHGRVALFEAQVQLA